MCLQLGHYLAIGPASHSAFFPPLPEATSSTISSSSP